MNELREALFYLWMKEKHPHFANVVFWGWVLLALAFIFSLVCVWVFPSIWWKVMVSTVGAGFLFSKSITLVTRSYIEEFKEN